MNPKSSSWHRKVTGLPWTDGLTGEINEWRGKHVALVGIFLVFLKDRVG
jgi:hypothetical protein